MKDVFDRIAASSPQNATAARVTGRGEHYDPVVKYAKHEHWDAPPKTKRFDAGRWGYRDLTGKRVGRLTVFGVYDAPPEANQKLRWVVRCACGDYEIRTSRALNNLVNEADECRKCNHWTVTKKRLSRLGSRSIDEIISTAK